MKEEIKEIWVNALNSGEYEQGEGRLRDGDKFCCLGVLCDLHNKGHEENAWELSKVSGASYYLNNMAALPNEVQEWAGLMTMDPSVGEKSLICLNDDGETFSFIADVIEEKF